MPRFTLDTLVPGESGRIVRIHGKGPIRRRLSDMGLTQGAVIDMVKRSPLGDPVEYRLRGYHLSLRKSEAQMVEVELLTDLPPRIRQQSGPGSVTSLVRTRTGEEVEIVRIRGGRRFQRHLPSTSLKPGSVLRVVQNDFPGPVIISIASGDRLVLGKGQARKILVRPAQLIKEEKTS